MDPAPPVRPYQRRQPLKAHPNPEKYAAKLAALQRRYAEDAEFRWRRQEYARNRAAALAAARRSGVQGVQGVPDIPGAYGSQ